MRRLLCAVIVSALTAGPAAAESPSLDAQLMAQPAAPVHAVGCSAERIPLRNGMNVRESASFEVTAAKTATAVRIGFAYFDVLGGRHISGALTTGTFSPGVRIDVHPFVGRIGPETHDVVCFAMEAAFADGTTWSLPPPAYPGNAHGDAAAGRVLPATILAAADAPVRLDRCTLYGPRNGIVATDLALTNTGGKTVTRVDVDFVFTDAGGANAPHYEFMRGSYAPGQPIAGSVRLQAADTTYVNVTCAVARVEFADGTAWGRAARTAP